MPYMHALPEWDQLARLDDESLPLLGTALLIARDEYPQLDADQRARGIAATRALKRAIDDAPKPIAWRVRDRIGDRRQWWTDVDEVR